MANLVKELGEGYVLERFAQTMFFNDKEQPSYIDPNRRATERGLATVALTGTAEKPVIENTYTPFDFFKDLSVFKLPDLGWRMAAEGRFLGYYRRNNRMDQTGYKRGLTPRNLERFVSPATEFLQDTGNLSEDHYTKPEVEVLLIMKPTYLRFKEGLQLMRAGKLFSFCTSPMIGIIPDVNDSQAIYFNTRQVAKVDNKGNIVCSNKVVERYLRDTL
jgi:hypothetical protein